MKKNKLVLYLLFLIVNIGYAQDRTIKVWDNNAPDISNSPRKEIMKKDAFGNLIVYNISEAELYVYLPDEKKRTGAAVIVCPGGGYGIEAIDHEGHAYAKFLKDNGIVGVVLKYRLPYGMSSVPISDGLQAVRLVRSKAKEWHVDANKIGIAGFSAGGHLASTIGAKWDLGQRDSNDVIKKLSSRPDFMLLFYPVISFKEDIGHMGTRTNLIGETHSWQKIKQYCNELKVTKETPPTFLLHCHDDILVSSINSIEYYKALRNAKVDCEMHIYPKGGHGFGMNIQDLSVDVWPKLSVKWIEATLK
ncbi:MAG: alpha/beta hydrolase [Labilibaculum sp.]|nr:alpha/beta hydrolase [Labilibaculum sp.]MBI9057327.1 alpha/beta hydrolase [Labilibaculum sp.]